MSISFVYGQAPRIGTLEIYGLHKVPESKVRRALEVKEGDYLPRSKGDTEERINQIDDVVESHLEAVCCEKGLLILYVGIEEKGAAHFDIREDPEGEITLPAELFATHRRLMEALDAAARRGVIAEDFTQGHALSADPAARAVQQMLPALADANLAVLRQVMRDSADPVHRAAAVDILAYATRKQQVVNDLQYALRDADPGVRASAARALGAMAVGGLRVEPTWFIEMLNSLSFSDRSKALWALGLLDVKDPMVIEQLRLRALPALVEMAGWKTAEHALPAYLLLGKIAGLPDQQVQDAWSRGDREMVIAAATGKKK